MSRKNVPEQVVVESKCLHRMVNRLNLYICCGGNRAFDFDRAYSELVRIRVQVDRLYITAIDTDPKFFMSEDDIINE